MNITRANLLTLLNNSIAAALNVARTNHSKIVTFNVSVRSRAGGIVNFTQNKVLRGEGAPSVTNAELINLGIGNNGEVITSAQLHAAKKLAIDKVIAHQRAEFNTTIDGRR